MFFNRAIVWDAPKIGLLIGAVSILVFGLLDDYFNFRPGPQFLFQAFLAGLLIFSGFEIFYLSNPFGEAFRLDIFSFPLFGQEISLLSALLVAFWLILIINAFNWLDGVDGLAGGVGLFGFLALLFLSISALVNQPPLGVLSVAMAGAVLGFLILNFPKRGGPANVMLGTSGSYFLGFMLAALSILSGAKIMTTFLVLSLPIFDALWVIWSRWRAGHSIFKKDRRHLHYRLLKNGFSPRKILLLYYSLAAVLAALAVFPQTAGKLFALLSVTILAFVF